MFFCMSRLRTNTHFVYESGIRDSGTFDLSLHCQCPSVVVTVDDGLWRDIFDLSLNVFLSHWCSQPQEVL